MSRYFSRWPVGLALLLGLRVGAAAVIGVAVLLLGSCKKEEPTTRQVAAEAVGVYQRVAPGGPPERTLALHGRAQIIRLLKDGRFEISGLVSYDPRGLLRPGETTLSLEGTWIADYDEDDSFLIWLKATRANGRQVSCTIRLHPGDDLVQLIDDKLQGAYMFFRTDPPITRRGGDGVRRFEIRLPAVERVTAKNDGPIPDGIPRGFYLTAPMRALPSSRHAKHQRSWKTAFAQ